MAHQVFISYSSTEAASAETVCAALEAAGITCWMAPRNITPGRDYAEQLVEAIRESRVLVLVFSAAANASEHIRRELDRAISAGIVVLPLRIEEVEPTGSLDYYLAGRQWCDAFPGPLEAHLEKLTGAVRDLLEAKKAPPSLASARRRRGMPRWLLGAAALGLAAVAALAVWAVVSSRTPDGPDGPALATSPSPEASTSLTTDQIKKKYGPGVVLITAKVPVGVNGRLVWKEVKGSGFVASKDGLIVTSMALVDPFLRRGPMVAPPILPYVAGYVTVEFFYSNENKGEYLNEKVRAALWGYDPFWSGLAVWGVLDPHEVDLVPIPLGDANTARVDEPVTVLYRALEPWGAPLLSHDARLAEVWHNELMGSDGVKTVPVLRADSPLDASGELGAPLLDSSGKVIGVAGPVPQQVFHSGTSDHSSSVVGSAMAVNWISGMVATFRQYREWKTWLDLWGEFVDPDLAKELGLPVSYGMLVAEVFPGGTGARAGIRGATGVKLVSGKSWQVLTGGDIIVSVDGKAVRGFVDFIAIFERYEPGDIVKVGLYRGHRLLTVKARAAAQTHLPAVPEYLPPATSP